MASESTVNTTQSDVVESTGQGRFAAIGGLLGAVLASSCCIGPLVLLSLGVSGAWISNLTALAPYQPILIGATLVFLAMGFWKVYFRPRKTCEPESYCGTERSQRVLKSALWVASALVVTAIGVNLFAPYLI